MIAHSFSGEVFGPARKLHGATYVVDMEFRRSELDADGIVVDIGRAGEALRSVLSEMNYRNLDDEEAFTGQNTTTEFLARIIFERMAARARSGELGNSAHALSSMRVVLHESHVAWAAYDNTLDAESGI